MLALLSYLCLIKSELHTVLSHVEQRLTIANLSGIQTRFDVSESEKLTDVSLLALNILSSTDMIDASDPSSLDVTARELESQEVYTVDECRLQNELYSSS